MNKTTVWQQLNHDTILHTVEKALGEKLSNLLLPRNSYINRVYELEKYDSRERLIVKFYRPGRWTKEMILEEHKFLAELAAKEIPVIPPISLNNKSLFKFESIPFAIFPKKGGRALDEFNKESWEEIGRRSGYSAAKLRKAEKTTTTNRQRRIGEFDWELLYRASLLNGVTDIALTFTDYINKDNVNAKRFEQLTQETITFIQELERIAGAPVSLIATGFNNRSIIDRRSW